MVNIRKFRIIVLVSNQIEYWSNYSIPFKISNIRTALVWWVVVDDGVWFHVTESAVKNKRQVNSDRRQNKRQKRQQQQQQQAEVMQMSDEVLIMMLNFVDYQDSLIYFNLLNTSCKYPSSGWSCLGPAGLYSLGPCGPLSGLDLDFD